MRNRKMKREMLKNASFLKESKRSATSEIKKWGKERDVEFPDDFVEFFAEFSGLCPEEWGYQFIPEDEKYLEFAVIGCFQYFDEKKGFYSVDDEYETHFLSWNQPLLIPFAWSEINVHAALDFRTCRRNPSVYNVEVHVPSRTEPDRPAMTWLADSFAEFLDILEPRENFVARHGTIYRF